MPAGLGRFRRGRDRAAPVAAAAYVAPVFGFLIDFFAFGVPPSIQALVGGTVVVGSGLYLLFKPGGSVGSEHA